MHVLEHRKYRTKKSLYEVAYFQLLTWVCDRYRPEIGKHAGFRWNFASHFSQNETRQFGLKYAAKTYGGKRLARLFPFSGFFITDKLRYI